MTKDALPWRDVQIAYARWYYACAEADKAYTNSEEFHASEDFGDFAEAMSTMRTFGPNPRRFDPPIYPTRSEANYMGHPEADVLIEDTTEEETNA